MAWTSRARGLPTRPGDAASPLLSDAPIPSIGPTPPSVKRTSSPPVDNPRVTRAPLFSAIVPTRDRPSHLESLLRALAAQILAPRAAAFA